MNWCVRSLLLGSSTLTAFLMSFSQVQALPVTELEIAQQPDPNQDRFLQGTPLDQQLPLNPDSEEKPIPTESTPSSEFDRAPDSPRPPSLPPTDLDEKVQVKKIVVTGITVDSIQTEFNRALAEEGLEGKTLTVRDLMAKTSDYLTSLYLERGYVTSFATLIFDPEELTSVEGRGTEGTIVEVRVTEGTIGNITINDEGRLTRGYIESRIRRGTGTPLNVVDLENHLRLLRTDPRISAIEPVLRNSGTPGTSNLNVTVVEAPAYGGQIFSDNYSPPSIGAERVGIEVFHRNLSGIGDELRGSYVRSNPGSSETVDLSYEVPLNGRNGSLALRTTIHDDEIIQAPFDQFDFRGEYNRYELALRQPIIRTLQREFALSAGFSFQNGQTSTFAGGTPFSIGPDADGVSRTSVLKFGQDYTRRDRSGAWALRSQLNFGIGLFDATINSEPVPDSRFFSWLFQAQRLHILSENNFVILQADFQLTPDSLLPSEQFVIGGGQSVRGFRQNVRAGDNGLRFLAENRIILKRTAKGDSVFQVAPFLNFGSVWSSGNNPNTLPDDKFILGLGTGLIWQPVRGLTARVDYAHPVIHLDDRGENAQDNGLYFS
jgi:hemolysin activation/secretion protein